MAAGGHGHHRVPVRQRHGADGGGAGGRAGGRRPAHGRWRRTLTVQWWCSARAVPWSWEWRPYPGVWLFVLLVAALYLLIRRRQDRLRAEPPPGWRRRAGWLGLVLVWLALDWPIGALGAGYLSSVHSTQFLLLTFIAPPLLLVGLGPGPPGEGRRGSTLMGILAAALSFNVGVLGTHLPRVVDALMPTQPGMFAIDAAWLLAGLVFWRPVLLTGRPFHPMARIGYIFWGTLAHTGIGVWFLLARLPLYGVFELAPPIPGYDPLSDQQLAGGIMELVGMLIIFGAVSLVALRWMQQENRLEQENRERLARKEQLPGT
ncbi:MAG: cytochrome c oxidase assembly protein [Gemmatimonadetes bacterium]|nr:cytochrome c oxidase assembly protein [Gemmatimonadota bacterium]